MKRQQIASVAVLLIGSLIHQPSFASESTAFTDAIAQNKIKTYCAFDHDLDQKIRDSERMRIVAKFRSELQMKLAGNVSEMEKDTHDAHRISVAMAAGAVSGGVIIAASEIVLGSFLGSAADGMAAFVKTTATVRDVAFTGIMSAGAIGGSELVAYHEDNSDFYTSNALDLDELRIFKVDVNQKESIDKFAEEHLNNIDRKYETEYANREKNGLRKAFTLGASEEKEVYLIRRKAEETSAVYARVEELSNKYTLKLQAECKNAPAKGDRKIASAHGKASRSTSEAQADVKKTSSAGAAAN